MQREKCKDAQQSLAVSPSDFFFGYQTMLVSTMNAFLFISVLYR